jgi:hypothetical protein
MVACQNAQLQSILNRSFQCVLWCTNAPPQRDNMPVELLDAPTRVTHGWVLLRGHPQTVRTRTPRRMMVSLQHEAWLTARGGGGGVRVPSSISHSHGSGKQASLHTSIVTTAHCSTPRFSRATAIQAHVALHNAAHPGQPLAAWPGGRDRAHQPRQSCSIASPYQRYN